MVAGHRRKKAADLAGLAEIPCIVRQLTDDEATIIMVDSNLQREQILPSEKAFAYKMKLDAMEVARLNMLKASHLNQVYALEELVYRKYPEEITRLTERIAGYEQDVALAAAHPKAQEGFCGMEVDGRHYTEKEDAGKAIIDVCTRMTGPDAVLLGQYRGFSMVLAYDGRSNEYRITLKGTLSHTVTLGADVFGNITRLDNALENLGGQPAGRAEQPGGNQDPA